MSLNVTRLIPQPLAACFARCLRMIDALGQAGRERMAAFTQGGADVARQAAAFGRLTRAVGLMMLLETRLKALVQAAANGVFPLPAAVEARETSVAPGERADVERDEPEDRPERPERPERLDERERFDFERRGGGWAADERPLSGIVAEICHDLGFDAEATRRAQAPFLELEALLAGEAPPDPHWDGPARRSLGEGGRSPGAPSPPVRSEAAQDARVDARDPKTPP